jgi:hypothetical protein
MNPAPSAPAPVISSAIDLAAAQAAMAHDPAVAAAIGPDFTVLRAGPAGEQSSPDRIFFVVKTPVPVVAPAGTWRWSVDAYGRPIVDDPLPLGRPNPPLQYYAVSLHLDYSLDSIVPFPGEQAEPGVVAPPPPVGTTPTPPTLAADLVAAGEAALRADPVVAIAIGTEFDILLVSPVGSYDHPSGLGFLVKTPRPVTLPAGTLTTKPTGEGGPLVIEPSPTPLGPASYINVLLNADLTVQLFLVVPDGLGAHEAEAASTRTTEAAQTPPTG